MRPARQRDLGILIWRERLGAFPRALHWLVIAVFGLGVTAYQFDPPIPQLYERGTILHVREELGKYTGNFPYLAVERPDGRVLSVRIGEREGLRSGQQVCVQLSRGWLFHRQSAILAGDEKCRA